MNIIMTGSTSFVGAATVRELLRRGHTVTAIVRPKSSKLDTILEGNEEALLSGRLLVTENDLSEPEKLLEKVTKPQDVFCHFGWGGSGSASRTDKALQEKNMEISLETIRTAKALGCKKFLFSGSQAEYGMHQTRMTEETECAPRSAYGEAKLRMRSTQKWNFIYITDLAKAVRALLETPETAFEEIGNPVFNVAGDDTRPLKEFVEEIHRLCKGGGSCLYGDRKENAEGAVNLIPDIGKICRVTGWKPETAFGEGIKKTLESR